MGRLVFLLFLFRLMASGISLLLAASPAEEKEFASAYRTWNFGFLDQAEKEFAEFIRKYPNSEHQNEAILNQAKLRLDPQSKAQQNFSGVVDLLSRNLNQAGSLRINIAIGSERLILRAAIISQPPRALPSSRQITRNRHSC